MSTKTLYVIIKDGGDGSQYANYTFDGNFVSQLRELCDSGVLGYEEGYGDGDGFHYDTLKVPEECTPASMGFRDCAYDLSEHFEEEEEDE